MQRSKLHRYSITSSALACNVKGMVMLGVRTLRHEPRGRPKDGRAVAVTRLLGRPTPCWQTRLSTPTSASSSLSLRQEKSSSFRPRAIESFNASTTRKMYKARHLMENFYCRLKQYRAIATRYDKTARNFLAAIHLGRR